MRAVFAAAEIPQPPYLVLSGIELATPSSDTMNYVETLLGYPCFVKPCNGCSSLGVSKVLSQADLCDALSTAAHHDRKVII